jgi:RHS repeat-associated protein
MTRDALGHVLTHTDGLYHTTTFTRDAQGRAVRVDYPDGGYETFTYNGFGEVLTHQLTNGGSESYVYDSRGMKSSWTDALGHTTTYGYDANDLLVSLTDPLGHATTFTNNERGQITKATYADATFASYAYDNYANQTGMTNELGKTWTSQFDAYKRKINVTDPLNRKTLLYYDEPGAGSGGGCGACGSGLGGTGNHLTTIMLPSGKTTRFAYDLAWRKVSVTMGYGTSDTATSSYSYDAVGNRLSMTDPLGNVTGCTYDARNRRLSATDPLSHTTGWTYDAVGNMLTERRADGGVTSYAYDPMNRRTRVTDPLSQVIQMAYDTAGRLTTLTDARSNAYGISYDQRNRKTQMTYPGGSHENWTYDPAGNLVAYTTRAGQVKSCMYDVRNRQTDASWNDSATPEVTSTYDLTGRVLTLNNINSALTYTYDDAGQVLTETQNITGGPGAKTLTYNYDSDGNRSSLLYPDGHNVTYAYTSRNQMASVTLDGSPPLATYTYDLAGNRLTKFLENGTTATSTYDDANQLLTIVHTNSTVTLASFAYTYNAVNDRTSATKETGLGDVYGYDATDQLLSVQYNATNPTGTPVSPQKTQGFVYDSVGNRTSASENGTATSYSANSSNEYTQIAGSAVDYDANGNLTSGPGLPACAYDAQNRLISAQLSGGSLMQTAYDACNRPVKRTVGGVVTNLCYDHWNLIAEYAGATGVESVSYVQGATTDELLIRMDSTGNWFYHHDVLGSAIALTNASGQLIEKYIYDVFGQPTIENASSVVLSASAYNNRFLFTGREWFLQSGLYDLRNRTYIPSCGRFAEVDPLGFRARDIDLYRYARNNPCTFVDQFGLDPVPVPPIDPGSGLPTDGFGHPMIPLEDFKKEAEACCKKLGGVYEQTYKYRHESASDCMGNYITANQPGIGTNRLMEMLSVIAIFLSPFNGAAAGVIAIPPGFLSVYDSALAIRAFLHCEGYQCFKNGVEVSNF